MAVGEAQRGRLVTLSPCLATRDQKRSIKALPGPRSICSGSCGQPCRLFAIILSERGCWRSAAACMLGLENHCTMNKSSFRVCLTFKVCVCVCSLLNNSVLFEVKRSLFKMFFGPVSDFCLFSFCLLNSKLQSPWWRRR